MTIYSSDPSTVLPSLFGINPTSAQSAEEQAAAFAASGCEAIYALRPLGNLDSVPLGDIILGQFPQTFDFWRRVALSIPRRPKLLVMDAEYRTDGNYSTPFGTDFECAVMEPRIQAIIPSNLRGMPIGRELALGWWEWAAPRYAADLRRNVRAAFASVFHEDIPCFNYADAWPSFPIWEANDWPIFPAGVTRISSPVLYVYDTHLRYKTGEHKKDVRWLRFVDCLNQLYSCCNSGPCIPWLAARSANSPTTWGPDKGMAYLADELVQHTCHAGVDAIIFQNTNLSPFFDQDARVMKALVKKYGAPRKRIGGRAPYNLDVDEVRTGSVRTTYAGFMKAASE